MARHGGVAGPAKERAPDRKGRLENPIQRTQSSALRGRRFETIMEQNAFLEQ